MSEETSIYERLGVDADKEQVRQVFETINDNDYKGAFVNIVADPYNKNRVMTLHQDGDGSKMIQRFLYYYATKDISVFEGSVDDAWSMNFGDVAAAGFVNGHFMVGDVLNLALPKEFKVKFMSQIANGFARVIDLYRRYGFSIKFLGGETADLPYQVRTGVFDVAVAAWEKKKNIIKGDVRPGDLIFGFPSDGQAAWETEWNSGIMSNGLTTARQCTMHHEYNSKYPNLRGDTYFYNGHYRYDDKPKILGGMTVNDALLSPTRHWAIVIKQIINCLEEVGALSMLHGITVNTGGGATKIKHLGKGGVTFIKDMIVSPPFFHFIQEASQETWKNMFKNFNCGIGIDVVGENNPIFIEALKQAALKCALPLYRLGSCEKSHDPEKNTVILNSQFGSWTYN